MLLDGCGAVRSERSSAGSGTPVGSGAWPFEDDLRRTLPRAKFAGAGVSELERMADSELLQHGSRRTDHRRQYDRSISTKDPCELIDSLYTDRTEPTGGES